MRPHWLLLIAVLGLAACQAREPVAPKPPGARTVEAPPLATATIPPPSVQPPPASAACPTPSAAACPPQRRVAAAASPARTRVAAERRARPQARVWRTERRDRGVDVPPSGGYRYEDFSDGEVVRRYEERRYGERHRRDGYDDHYDERRYDDRPYHDRPYEERRYDDGRYDRGWDETRRRPPPPPGYRRDRRGDAYAYERRGRAGEDYAYERREDRHRGGGYDRRSGHVAEAFRDDRGGLRRYEERSYEAGGRSTERYSESYGLAQGGVCCRAAYVAPAAGRDAYGFLTWPGKVPAVP